VITIACWKWKRTTTGHQLPHVVDYGPEHVHTMQSMLERNVTVPYRFVCITDDPTGLDCETIPLWEVYEAGGCYHRLRAFSPEISEILGNRFCWIDLDAVIVDNIDPILSIEDDFAIHQYAYKGKPEQHYNGGLVIMSAGVRAEVWDAFHPTASPRIIARMNEEKRLIGSDQAWISHVLGPGERTLGPADGVYEAMPMEKSRSSRNDRHPPKDARIVLFSGPRDPTSTPLPWVKEYYR
jgi:hypothetical protein